MSPAPLKRIAPPNRPRVVQFAPSILPALPLPEASLATRPDPASSEYAATSPRSDALRSLPIGADISACTSDEFSARS